MIAKGVFLIICSFLITCLGLLAVAEPKGFPEVEAWSPQSNRTVWITINGEIGVYISKSIEHCTGKEMGWVLRTQEDHPYCYMIGERIGTIILGQFVPFIEKTS